MQWLLGFDRRRRKAFSLLMVFLKRAVPTAKTMYIKSWGRKHIVEKYSCGGKPGHWASKG